MTGLVASGHPLVSQEFHNGGNRKRSHHSLVKDEVEEDELSDELSNPTEKKRRLTTDQVKFLEMSFSMDLKLEPERKALLAKKLGIRPRQVAIWFQNRRARWKNKQLEQDYENLKTNFESVVKEKEKLLAERESVLEQNKQLQAQVFHLSGLLERMRNSASSDITTGTGSDGKSELTSPTKSSDDQGEVQDSGQSNCLSGGLEIDPVVPPIWELNPGLVCPYNIKSEAEHASIFSTDEFYGSNLTLLFHAPTVNGVFLEDGFYPNYEDQFGGLACQEYMVP